MENRFYNENSKKSQVTLLVYSTTTRRWFVPHINNQFHEIFFGYFFMKKLKFLGSYLSMDEPMIREMLSVYAERLPKYYQENLSEFRSREVEGLCHGDFHTGNHMFGKKLDEDNSLEKVIVYDFQGAGPGLVSKEVVRMMGCMEIENYDQVVEIAQGTYYICTLFFRSSTSFFFCRIFEFSSDPLKMLKSHPITLHYIYHFIICIYFNFASFVFYMKISSCRISQLFSG